MGGLKRLAIFVQGIVQGVGFRPFVYRLASERGLVGWVRNQPDGVHMEVQGQSPALDAFLDDLRTKLAAPASIARLDVREIRTGHDPAFSIVASEPGADIRPSIPADLATCADCARETETPGERRHGYPFTNCTRCGPRYSIVVSLP
jgi:hydrogenase maturation protein HypF